MSCQKKGPPGFPEGLATNYFAYNFIKIHRTLRVSPAMAAGVTTRPFEVSDLLAYWSRLNPEKPRKSTAVTTPFKSIPLSDAPTCRVLYPAAGRPVISEVIPATSRRSSRPNNEGRISAPGIKGRSWEKIQEPRAL